MAKAVTLLRTVAQSIPCFISHVNYWEQCCYFHGIVFLKTIFHHLQRRQLQLYYVTFLFILLCAFLCSQIFPRQVLFRPMFRIEDINVSIKCSIQTLLLCDRYSSFGAYKFPFNIRTFCKWEVWCSQSSRLVYWKCFRFVFGRWSMNLSWDICRADWGFIVAFSVPSCKFQDIVYIRARPKSLQFIIT
jgi:hypothetical protein